MGAIPYEDGTTFRVWAPHAKAVFVTGTLCAMVAQMLRALDEPSLGFDSLLLAAGIAAQLAVAYFLEWKSQLARRSTAPAKAPAAAKPAVSRAPLAATA